jgi:sterol desaturase/sphingolipid hydroxylase (fatty acid hydroxylase superfamily)
MENEIRLTIAASIFIVMVTWEFISPRRKQSISRKRRWPVNLGLAIFNMSFMRLTIGGLAYLSAAYALENHWGVLNIWQPDTLVAALLTLVLLDFAIYSQHIAMHKVPLLWRLHKIHHTDLEFDATTAVRFHPLEIGLSMLYKVLCIVLIGANPEAVIAFEIILNGCATFNHSNVYIPEKLDHTLRWLLITPDMHRIHHSAEPSETDSNYGFSVSWWDRLCKTYVPEPSIQQTQLTIGLKPYRNIEKLSFPDLLKLPFV